MSCLQFGKTKHENRTTIAVNIIFLYRTAADSLARRAVVVVRGRATRGDARRQYYIYEPPRGRMTEPKRKLLLTWPMVLAYILYTGIVIYYVCYENDISIDYDYFRISLVYYNTGIILYRARSVPHTNV